jgi:hypothetical protein
MNNAEQLQNRLIARFTRCGIEHRNIVLDNYFESALFW